MAQDIAQEQVVKLLKQNIAQHKSELADVQAKAEQLKASIVSYERMLARVAPDEVASTPTDVVSETGTLALNPGQVASTISLGADEHLKGGLANVSFAFKDAGLEKASSQNKDQRNPVQMKRPQYLGLTFTQSIEKVLNDRQEPMLVDRIVEAIFDAEPGEEFFRAKNSLSVELRRGAETHKRWKKLSRNIYASNLCNEQSASNNGRNTMMTPQVRFSPLTNSDDALSS